MMLSIMSVVFDSLNGLCWLWLFAMIQFLAYGLLVGGMIVKTREMKS
jgi:hypothetical protein